eukprot:6267342-Prymnesium_polylepis.1
MATGLDMLGLLIMAQSLSSPPTTVNVGVMYGMFYRGPDGFVTTDASTRRSIIQASDEINNKSDGVFDYLLPRTTLRIAFRDSQCDSTPGLLSAVYLTHQAFGGEGVSAIVGAACSGASTAATRFAGAFKVPMVSPSATSPTLSNGKEFPYFLRVAPSDAFICVAMVDLLQSLWNYTQVALVHSTDSFGSGGAAAFKETAFRAGLEYVDIPGFSQLSTQYTEQHRALKTSGARVIVLFCTDAAIGFFLRTAYEEGIGGEGFLWLGADTLGDSQVWEGDAQLASDFTLRQLVLKGAFAVGPGVQEDLATYQTFQRHRAQLHPTTKLSDGSCNLEQDDDGNYVWAGRTGETDDNPLICA